jgi:hypothetical protein
VSSVFSSLGRYLLSSVQVWTNLLELFAHYTTCQVDACKHRTSEVYVNAVRSALIPGPNTAGLWATTLGQLEKNLKSPYAAPSKSERQRRELWISLGRGVGLTAPTVAKKAGTPTALIPTKVEDMKKSERAKAKQGPAEPRIPESMIGCWNVQCPNGKHGAGNEQEAEEMKRCSGCSVSRYCDSECQLK